MRTQATSGLDGTGLTFYSGIALAFAATVFVGFAPTFYLKPVFATPALTGLAHLHGVVFTAWIAIFIAQTFLVARGRTDLHQRLGIAGAGVAAAMIVVGMMTAFAAAARGFTPPNGPPPLVFLAIPFFDIVAFAGLVGAGILRRTTPETHKRLMVMATIAIIDAAVARLPVPIEMSPPVFFALSDLFIVAVIVHDIMVRGRPHRATVAGGLWVLALQVIRLIVAETGPWLGFARWITGVT